MTPSVSRSSLGVKTGMERLAVTLVCCEAEAVVVVVKEAEEVTGGRRKSSNNESCARETPKEAIPSSTTNDAS